MALSASDVLKQLGALFAEEAFQAFNPVIGNTLADIAANPAQWTNPATAVIKGAAAVANLAAAVPNLEAEAVTGAAQLVATLWQAVGSKATADVAALLAAPATTPPPAPAVLTPVQATAVDTAAATAIGNGIVAAQFSHT